jgi:glutamyl-tRNA reductase
VKRSLAWSQSAGTTSRILHRLWERALRVGKRVRTETAIGLGALSASYAALELARKIFGGLEDKNVLVIGTGEIGLLVLEDLKGVPVGSLTVMNRTRSVAEGLARRFGGAVRGLEELPDALVDADLVISSTGSREPLIRYAEMKRIRGRRRGTRPLLVVDLAVPRDFDERCGTLDEVFLKNVDDLTEIVEEHVAERRDEIPRAEGIIDREVAGFYRWIQTLDVEPTIRKLRELFHSIRAEELALLSAQTLSGHSEEDGYRRFDRFSERLVNHLLHVLSSNLRRHEGLRDQELISVVHQILTEEIPRPGRGPQADPK